MKQRSANVAYGHIYQKQYSEKYRSFESAIAKHDKYLIELQKQKKLAKNIHHKDKVTEERERKEKGFSLYVNGANAVSKPTTTWSKKNNLNKSKLKENVPEIKTACTSPRKQMVNHRLKSAPESSPRKFWGQGSVEIATSTGAKLYASVGAINNNYSEDFEESIDFEPENLSDSDTHLEIVTAVKRPKSVPVPKRKFWGQGSVTVKADDGEDLRASVSNIMTRFDYSMDFEECSDDESLSDCPEEISEEIESDSLNGSGEHMLVLDEYGKVPYSSSGYS